jgi:hypothetical protein
VLIDLKGNQLAVRLVEQSKITECWRVRIGKSILGRRQAIRPLADGGAVLALGACALQLTIRFLSLGIEGSSVLIFQHTPGSEK